MAPKKSTAKTKPKAKADKKSAAKADPKPGQKAYPERAFSGARMISQNDLKNLLRRSTSDANQISTINGSLRERIAEACEKKNLDKRAFALLRRLDKMENEDLAALWDNLDAYMDMAGLWERIESVGKLPLEPTPEETAKEAAEPKDETPPAPEAKDGDTVSRPRLATVGGASAV